MDSIYYKEVNIKLFLLYWLFNCSFKNLKDNYALKNAKNAKNKIIKSLAYLVNLYRIEIFQNNANARMDFMKISKNVYLAKKNVVIVIILIAA